MIASKAHLLLIAFQSSVILSCSNGMGTKVSSTIVREASSGSQCGGTSCRIKSGRTESSVKLQISNDADHNRKASSRLRLTFACKIEEWGEILPIWHSRTFCPQLVKEGLDHRFHRAEARSWCVLQQL